METGYEDPSFCDLMRKIWRRIIGSGRNIKVSVKEFQTLVATGEVKHVAGLAAWARWMSREDEK